MTLRRQSFQRTAAKIPCYRNLVIYLRKTPNGPYAIIPIIFATMAWIISLISTTFCTFVNRNVEMTGNGEIDTNDESLHLMLFRTHGIGFWGWEASNNECYSYSINGASPSFDVMYTLSNISTILTDVLGGVCMVICWLGSCFLISSNQYRYLGIGLIVTCVFEFLTLCILGSNVCGPLFFDYVLPTLTMDGDGTSARESLLPNDFTLENNIRTSCSLGIGSQMSITAGVFWLISGLICIKSSLSKDKGIDVDNNKSLRMQQQQYPSFNIIDNDNEGFEDEDEDDDDDEDGQLLYKQRRAETEKRYKEMFGDDQSDSDYRGGEDDDDDYDDEEEDDDDEFHDEEEGEYDDDGDNAPMPFRRNKNKNSLLSTVDEDDENYASSHSRRRSSQNLDEEEGDSQVSGSYQSGSVAEDDEGEGGEEYEDEYDEEDGRGGGGGGGRQAPSARSFYSEGEEGDEDRTQSQYDEDGEHYDDGDGGERYDDEEEYYEEDGEERTQSQYEDDGGEDVSHSQYDDDGGEDVSHSQYDDDGEEGR